MNKNIKDLTGMRFNRLEVLSNAGRPAGRRGTQWLCRCDCGDEVVIRGDTLQTESQSCGGPLCLHAAKHEYPLPGEKFGMLEAVGHARTSTSGHYWMFKCECGNTAEMRLNRVKSGERDHCGCKSIEKMVLAHVKEKDVDRDRAPFRDLLHGYRNSANNRGLEFSLTEKQFFYLTKQNCFYCNVPPGNKRRVRERKILKNGQPFLHNGVDRWNAREGYTVENSVPCCSLCNYAKSSVSGDDFIVWITRLRDYVDELRINTATYRKAIIDNLIKADEEI